MILTGSGILEAVKDGLIEITRFDEKRLNPNSYNLTLDKELIVYKEYILDMKKPNDFVKITIPEEGFVLEPGRLYLGSTVERTCSLHYVPMIEGRSSFGRLGLFIHATAGFGDIGFNGKWTLEFSCVEPIRIYSGVEICQIYFHTAIGPNDRLYNGKYQNSSCVEPSYSWKDFQ